MKEDTMVRYTTYTIRGVDKKFWRKVKAVCAYRGISVRAFIMDKLKRLVKDSEDLEKRERKAGL